MMDSQHQPHPPPKPPHIQTMISVDSARGVSPRDAVASPMTDLANNFRQLSSSSSSCGSNSSMCSGPGGKETKMSLDKSITPVRGKQLCFSTTATPLSDEELEPDDDGVNLQPPRPYTAREAANVLLQADSSDKIRFQQRAPYRRKLFTNGEKNFNRLRRLNSCGTQAPRTDEKLIGRSKTVETSALDGAGRLSPRVSPLVNRARVTTAPPSSLNCSLESEKQTDQLFEITARARSKSYNRHRSDSSTPLRGQAVCSPLRLSRLSKVSSQNSSKMSIEEDQPQPHRPPRMHQTSTLQPHAQDFYDFFENFSDDGLGMDDTDDEDSPVLPSSDTSTTPDQASTPARLPAPQTPPPLNVSSHFTKNIAKAGLDISPLAAPLLAKKAKSKKQKGKMVQKFASPMSMNNLLTGDILTNKGARRGLFKDPTGCQQASSSSVAGKPPLPSRILSPRATHLPLQPPSPLLCSPLMKRSGRAMRRKSIKSRRIVSNSPIGAFRVKAKSSVDVPRSPQRRVSVREPTTPQKGSPEITSPSKRFLSPDTPSKIRVSRQRRRIRGPYSRAKSVTFSALRQLDPNLPQPQPAFSKNYKVSACPDHQAALKRGLDRVASMDELCLGDHSERKLKSLKTVQSNGKHPQLTHISPSGLAALLQKTPPTKSPVKYDIVDCRYPYEFAGGRIEHAINIHNEKQLYNRYFSPVKVDEATGEPTTEPNLEYKFPPQDTVLIFHCEFSSERAPRMMKTLREIDRSEHKYPRLKYPELYLLKGGYKDFFEVYPELCDKGYVRMLDTGHAEDLEKYRKFREKSKTWCGKQAGSRLQKMKQKRKLF